jgi:hypothetical protein
MRHPQQYRRVRIVTTSVHHSCLGGGECSAAFFEDGQSVHVGSNADGRTIASANLANHPGFPYLGTHRNAADFVQGIGHQSRRAYFLEAQLRVSVDVAAQAYHLGMELLGTFKHICHTFAAIF